MDIKIDDEFQSLISPLTDDEYRRLEKSILAEGVREPIITWNGTIIDGHNRYRICQEHGIVFGTTKKEFTSREAAKIWIIENQFGRRNLDKYDRGVLTLKLKALYAAEAKKRHGGDRRSEDYQKTKSQNSGACSSARTDEQLAKLAGMSRDTIRKIEVIETEAEKGNETAIKARDAIKSKDKETRKSIHGAYLDVRHNGDESDSRPLCSICGKPIESGDHYPKDRFKHKKCANRLEHENKKANGNRYEDADRDLRENVPTYTVELLLASLEMGAKDLCSSWTNTIRINENMGAKLTESEKLRIEEAANNLLLTIQTIKEERNNG